MRKKCTCGGRGGKAAQHVFAEHIHPVSTFHKFSRRCFLLFYHRERKNKSLDGWFSCNARNKTQWWHPPRAIDVWDGSHERSISFYEVSVKVPIWPERILVGQTYIDTHRRRLALHSPSTHVYIHVWLMPLALMGVMFTPTLEAVERCSFFTINHLVGIGRVCIRIVAKALCGFLL